MEPGATTASRVITLGVCLLVLLRPFASSAGIRENIAIRGYVQEEPVLLHTPLNGFDDEECTFVNILRARENVRWYASSAVTFALEVELQWLQGSGACETAGLIAPMAPDAPLLDLHARFDEAEDACLEAAIDRLWVDVTRGDLQVTAGRQRVAWGTNLVWNPVDIFNPTPALAFDAEEDVGTDAIRAQYYIGPNSQFDLAWSPARDPNQTNAAARLKINRAGYDWIAIGGRRALDTVGGFAWAGSVAGAGFRGEILYGRPEGGAGGADESYVNASVSGDYAWANTLYLQVAALYNSRGTTGDAGGPLLLDACARRDLSPARGSVFVEVAKDLTPLWRVDVSGIVNPADGSSGILPSLRWSATTNLDITLSILSFDGRHGTEFGDQGWICAIAARYSF